MHPDPEYSHAIRIAYVCNEYPGVTAHFGGIGVAFQAEAEWLARAGNETHVLVQHPAVAPGQKTENGVIIHSIRTSGIPKVAAALDRFFLSRSVASIMGKSRGIVVAADYGALLLSKPFHQPLAVQLHGCSTLNALQRNERPRKIVRALERRQVQIADGIRSVSDFTASMTFRALGVSPRTAVVIPNAVDSGQFRPDGSSPVPGRVLFVGKLNTVKGARVLSQFIGPVLESVPGAQFIIIGQDTVEGGTSVRDAMERTIPSALLNRVIFKGRVPRSEVVEEIRSSSLVVVPSLSEACPMVVLESMACGRPVVASRRAAIPEFVMDGVTGLLADPEDPRSFTGAVATLLRDPGRARAMGEQAREQALHLYAQEPVMRRLHAFYLSLLDGEQPVGRPKGEMAIDERGNGESSGIPHSTGIR